MADDSLGGDAFSFFVGGGFEFVVLSDSFEEGGAGSGELEVFDADVDAFGDDALTDLFVDYDSDGSGVDVEDAACASVVVFVGHTFVDGSINDDIDDVSDLVGGEGLGDVDGSYLSESFSEFVSGFAFVSVAVGHGSQNNNNLIKIINIIFT